MQQYRNFKEKQYFQLTQGRIKTLGALCIMDAGSLPLLCLYPLPFSPCCLPALNFSSLPLEVGPLKFSNTGSGERVSSPSGVWGGSPAEIEFGAF
jgi:hypothetical protein